MDYKGYEIEQDKTGYAPDHLKFGFFDNEGECQGMGGSIDDCKKQIDELILEKTQ